MEAFLGLLQDFCLHVCLTCNQSCGDGVDGHTSLQEHKQHAHLLRQPDRSDDMREKSQCRLYHSHSVVSAILSAKALVGSGRKGSAGPGSAIISKITLSKEDNSGLYIGSSSCGYGCHNQRKQCKMAALVSVLECIL